MAQELTFTMLAHAVRSTHDGPNSYVTIILTFLQTVLQHPEGLAMLERAIPWAVLAAFFGRGLRVLSSYTQSEKLGKSSILPEDWAMRGMLWPGQLFERGFWDGGDGQLMHARTRPSRPVDTTLIRARPPAPVGLQQHARCLMSTGLCSSLVKPFITNLSDPLFGKILDALQLLARTAGCLALPTPRDAFLTALAKAAFPPPVVTALDDRHKRSRRAVLPRAHAQPPRQQ